jgi:hypothetical protein
MPAVLLSPFAVSIGRVWRRLPMAPDLILPCIDKDPSLPHWLVIGITIGASISSFFIPILA